VRVGTRGDVDDAFAVEEGEGFQNRVDWWRDQAAFFSQPAIREELGDPDFRVDDTTRLVLQRFRLVGRLV
jgi:uncharacterized protein YhfF